MIHVARDAAHSTFTAPSCDAEPRRLPDQGAEGDGSDRRNRIDRTLHGERAYDHQHGARSYGRTEKLDEAEREQDRVAILL
jgi:hypothetical protein